MLNYYDLLEIDKSATESEIKSAFKRKAILYHPDKNPENPSEELFKEINSAYQVLSNPYERARYDLLLTYGASQQIYYDQPTQQGPQNYKYQYARPHGYRYQYTRPDIDYKQNWIATAYAFGFTFIVASLVIIAITIKNYYDQQIFMAKLGDRREVFNEALKYHENGDYISSLRLIRSMGVFLESEEDIVAFKTNFVNEMVQQGEYHFLRAEYSEALYYLELIENEPNVPKLLIKEYQALSYKNLNQPEEAIKILTQLLVMDYRTLFTYIELAEIHRDYLNDYESAKNYFELANEVAKNQYEAFYGKAYAVIISQRNLPEIHHRLYVGLADSYLQTGNPEMAIKATNWNISIWPERSESYLISAKAFQQIGNLKKSCQNYRKAQEIGTDMILNIQCPN